MEPTLNEHEFLWTERHRPNRVVDVILPASTKAAFQKFVDQKEVPNLLLTGGAGIGKTTVAIAMLEEIGADYIVVNGSKDGNIDTLRDLITTFASSVSFTGGRKYVILDEADYLNPNSTQPALRNFMETFSQNCGFILTANFPSKIIEPLQSRCSVVDFKINNSDKAKLATQFLKRIESILTYEKVEYEKAVLAQVIMKWFPDWRRVLNQLQTFATTGKIDASILANMEEISLTELFGYMKAKEFSKVRKWVAENADQSGVFRKFYDVAEHEFTVGFTAQLVLLLARYQFQGAFAVDPEINMAAFLIEVMIEAEWKS